MNENSKFRSVFFYKDYFKIFFDKQNEKVKEKIIWTIRIIEYAEKVPSVYLKYIENTDGLFEIRIQFGNNIFRVFCFFDEGRLVVLANGFQKKTQKTPMREIKKALKIKKEYENEK